jgi:hypothetical protein
MLVGQVVAQELGFGIAHDRLYDAIKFHQSIRIMANTHSLHSKFEVLKGYLSQQFHRVARPTADLTSTYPAGRIHTLGRIDPLLPTHAGPARGQAKVDVIATGLNKHSAHPSPSNHRYTMTETEKQGIPSASDNR